MPERDRTSQQQTQDDDRQKAIEQILEENRRWLPPSPHAEKMAEAVAAGRCHIQHRGHGQAPLLVFFDGGAMQLPTVRWANTARGWRFTAESSEHSPDQTTHLDVCGTVDTIEQAIEGEPQLEGLSMDHDTGADLPAETVRRNFRRMDEAFAAAGISHSRVLNAHFGAGGAYRVDYLSPHLVALL